MQYDYPFISNNLWNKTEQVLRSYHIAFYEFIKSKCCPHLIDEEPSHEESSDTHKQDSKLRVEPGVDRGGVRNVI